MTARQRPALWFAAIVVLATAVVIWSLRGAPGAPGSDSVAERTGTAPLTAPPTTPYVVVRHLVSGPGWNHVALAPLDAPDGPRYVTPLDCVRVYVAAGRGICLKSNGADGRAIVFDERFTALRELALTGPPSRARVSRDGRLGAVTVFESGHSYADVGFSTRTTILDLESGTAFPDLESFTVRQDGREVRRIDVNYWGVTFIPESRRFYATLAFGGTPYLVEGDLDGRDVRVVAAHVECPSLSPMDAASPSNALTACAGACGSASSPPAPSTSWPARPGASTTRWSGSTTRRCSTSTRRTKGTACGRSPSMAPHRPAGSCAMPGHRP